MNPVTEVQVAVAVVGSSQKPGGSLSTSEPQHKWTAVWWNSWARKGGGAGGNLLHYKCGTQPESHYSCRRSRVGSLFDRPTMLQLGLAFPRTFCLVTRVTVPNLVIHEHTKGRESQDIAQGHAAELGNRDLLMLQKCISRWCSICGDHVCKQVGGV